RPVVASLRLPASSHASALTNSSQCCSTIRRTPTTSPFPYTTLFRSGRHQAARGERREDVDEEKHGVRQPEPACDRPDGRQHEHRSEEHTSELQSPRHLVCRLLLEKKTKHYTNEARMLMPSSCIRT